MYFRCRISVCDLKTEDCSIKCPRSQLRRKRRQIESGDAAGEASTVVTSAKFTVDIPTNETFVESNSLILKPENKLVDTKLLESQFLSRLNELQIKQVPDRQIGTLEICLIAAIGFLAL